MTPPSDSAPDPGTEAPRGDLDALYRAERRRLWALAYRMTGTADEADDVVQAAFERLLVHAPDPARAPGWLMRTTTNLAIDALRRRRRRGYPGPWLPGAVETGVDDPFGALADAAANPAQRYEQAESVTFAFLLALEAQQGGTRRVLREVNGLPALWIEVLEPVRRQAPHTLLRCELDADGRIEWVQAVLAPRKLAALHFA